MKKDHVFRLHNSRPGVELLGRSLRDARAYFSTGDIEYEETACLNDCSGSRGLHNGLPNVQPAVPRNEGPNRAGLYDAHDVRFLSAAIVRPVQSLRSGRHDGTGGRSRDVRELVPLARSMCLCFRDGNRTKPDGFVRVATQVACQG